MDVPATVIILVDAVKRNVMIAFRQQRLQQVPVQFGCTACDAVGMWSANTASCVMSQMAPFLRGVGPQVSISAGSTTASSLI
jgi:hypothetical protein